MSSSKTSEAENARLRAALEAFDPDKDFDGAVLEQYGKLRRAALSPPGASEQSTDQGAASNDERLWDIACDCLRFRKTDPLRLAENTTVERILAALAQARAEEAEACAKIAEIDSHDVGAWGNPVRARRSIAAAIRARHPKEKGE